MSKRIKVRVGIVNDPVGALGQTPGEEAQDILLEMEGWDIEPVLITHGLGMHVIRDRNIDILVIDYGGMSYGAGDTAEWQVKEAITWAKDHPGKLLILWTDFTQRIYECELKSIFGELDNVLYRFPGESFCEGIEEKARMWLGVPPSD